MRNPYKMRKVIEVFSIPSSVNPNVQVPRVALECGHIVRGRIGNKSKAELIADLARALSGSPAKRRCFSCGKAARSLYEGPVSEPAED